MKLVKFSNGKFGVRTYWWFGWHFIDLTMCNYDTHRKAGHKYFEDCQGAEEKSRKVLQILKERNNPKHEVVDDDKKLKEYM